MELREKRDEEVRAALKRVMASGPQRFLSLRVFKFSLLSVPLYQTGVYAEMSTVLPIQSLKI